MSYNDIDRNNDITIYHINIQNKEKLFNYSSELFLCIEIL